MNQTLNALAQAALNEELAQYVAQLRAGNNIDSAEPIDQAVAANAMEMPADARTFAAQLLIAAGTAMLRETQVGQYSGISCQWYEMLEEFNIVVSKEHRWALEALRNSITKDLEDEQAVLKMRERLGV